jgi:hypothetical protein
LRLFKKADVEVPCLFLLEKEEDFVANVGFSLGETSYSDNPYCLEKKEIPDFVRLWNKLKGRDAKPNLHFSFHEFSQAFGTHIIEYRIYHYVVALESIVFCNIDRTFPHKGSLIGLSIGMLLGTSQKERDSIRENGFNSFLHASKCSRRPVTARKSRGNVKPKTDDQNGKGE